jgi:predicted permease
MLRLEGVMLWDELGHALRRVRAQPGTAALAAGMLAVAIGVAAAMFTIADHLLIRPVPYRDPATLVVPYLGTGPNHMLPYVSPAVARAWRASAAFSSVQVVVQRASVLDGPDGPVIASTMWMSPGTFEMIGVAPALGRAFVPGEGRPGADDRVVISDTLWQRQFGRDPQILNRRVRVSGVPSTIVGVMPPGFHFPYWNTDLWRPYDVDSPPPAAAGRPLIAYARLAAGIPRDDAGRLATASAAAAEPLKGQHVILRGVGDGFLDDYSRTAIAALAGGVGLVFLVLCANVTNLMLARTTARRQEFGVCSALGASRGRLLRQAFLEVVVTTAAGAAVGFAITWLLVALARDFLPADFLARTLNPVQVDLRAVAGASALAFIAAVVAGIPPAWIGTAQNPVDSMRGVGRGGTESRASRAWTRGLLVGEVALATALLAGAGVLVMSFAKLIRTDPGLRLDGVTVVTISLPAFSFQDKASRAAFADHLQREVAALPGVEQTALSLGNPAEGGSVTDDPFLTDSKAGTEQHLGIVDFSNVGPGFFGVYGIDILQGREFGPGDGPDTAIVSARLASALWPGESAVGHAFTIKGSDRWYRVVGVSREVHSGSFLDPLSDAPEFYTPLEAGGSTLFAGLRCTGACPDEHAIRTRVRSISPNAVVDSAERLEDTYREQFDRPRAAAGLAFAFAVVSLFAAAGGLFSVLSYAVRRRRREFGIRVAMGARPQAIRRLVLADGIRVAAAGLAFGAIGTWMLSRVLATLAYGVTIRSPLVWAATAGAIAVASLLAAWLPALSAMRTDPLVLLRDE